MTKDEFFAELQRLREAGDPDGLLAFFRAHADDFAAEYTEFDVDCLENYVGYAGQMRAGAAAALQAQGAVQAA